MKRFLAFLFGVAVSTAVLWSFAFPAITSEPFILHTRVHSVSFMPIWKAWDLPWAYGWLAAELVVSLGMGAGAACFVPDR